MKISDIVAKLQTLDQDMEVHFYVETDRGTGVASANIYLLNCVTEEEIGRRFGHEIEVSKRPCPICKAEPGADCITTSGKVTRYHSFRYWKGYL